MLYLILRLAELDQPLLPLVDFPPKRLQRLFLGELFAKTEA